MTIAMGQEGRPCSMHAWAVEVEPRRRKDGNGNGAIVLPPKNDAKRRERAFVLIKNHKSQLRMLHLHEAS